MTVNDLLQVLKDPRIEQIFDGRVIKGWGCQPGVRVTISEVDSNDDFSRLIGEEK